LAVRWLTANRWQTAARPRGSCALCLPLALLGQRYEAIADREVRETLYGHHRIAYLIVNEERIEILGIFHGAMDIEHYLK
jgi:plasmid stabilization system protein ParE